MASKRNLLIVVPRLPWPLSSGGDQAIYNGIAAVKDGCNVYVTYMVEGKEKNAADRLCLESVMGGVKFIPFENKSRSFASFYEMCVRRSRNLFFPRVTNDFYRMFEMDRLPSGFLEHISGLVEKYSIDLVQVEMLREIAAGLALPDGVKKIFVHHELAFVRNELTLETVGETIYRKAAVAANRAMEIGLLNEYDAVVTLSETDRLKLIDKGVTVPVHASFSVVKLNDNMATVECSCTELSYLGPEKHVPNVVAVRWFLENCWEDLLKKNPDYHLRIIGKWSPSTVSELTSKYRNLRFCGFVENLEDELAGTVMIVPLTIGSGIRMKIIEAANMNVPVVTTSVGVEGLGFTSGVNCLIADTPEAFVTAIESLSDEGLRNSIIRSAKDHISGFSLEKLGENRLAIYKEVLN